jgi:hypothetical protein
VYGPRPSQTSLTVLVHLWWWRSPAAVEPLPRVHLDPRASAEGDCNLPCAGLCHRRQPRVSQDGSLFGEVALSDWWSVALPAHIPAFLLRHAPARESTSTQAAVTHIVVRILVLSPMPGEASAKAPRRTMRFVIGSSKKRSPN